MNLIDRDKALKTIPSEEMVARMAVMSAPVVDAIPIDFIMKEIDEYREKEDQIKDEPLSGYFGWVNTSERRSLEWLLLDWKAEQEKQNDTD